MRKLNFTLLLIFLITSACNFSLDSSSAFNKEVATRAAIALTGTAENKQNQVPYTETTIPSTITPKMGKSPETSTPTASTDDPKLTLGEPTWKDTLSSGNSFGLDPDGIAIDSTVIKVKNGKLVMFRGIASGGKTWWLAYPQPKNFYLEAKFETSTCSGNDQYGLAFRAINYEDGYAYYFIITCDGHYSLLKQTTNGSSWLFDWQISDEIHKGSNQTNILGVWAKEKNIKLYVNNKLLKELDDTSLPNEGHFGPLIDARETAGFTIKMDEITYWKLP